MRFYIYGEGEVATETAERVKGEGHTAFIRNPDFFGADGTPDLKCDVAITDNPTIAAAFEAVGVEVQTLGSDEGPLTQTECDPDADTWPDGEPIRVYTEEDVDAQLEADDESDADDESEEGDEDEAEVSE